MTGVLFTKLIMPGMNKQHLHYVISFEQLKKIKEVCFIRESIFPFFFSYVTGVTGNIITQGLLNQIQIVYEQKRYLQE